MPMDFRASPVQDAHRTHKQGSTVRSAKGVTAAYSHMCFGRREGIGAAATETIICDWDEADMAAGYRLRLARWRNVE